RCYRDWSSDVCSSDLRRDLDLKAQAAIDEHQLELRFKRLSMDALRECMQVLEKNTVAAELHDDDTGEHCYRVGALAKELALKKRSEERRVGKEGKSGE